MRGLTRWIVRKHSTLNFNLFVSLANLYRWKFIEFVLIYTGMCLGY